MRGERERERECGVSMRLRLFQLICIIHIIFTILQMIITLFYGHVHVVVIITERNNFCSRTRFYVYATISTFCIIIIERIFYVCSIAYYKYYENQRVNKWMAKNHSICNWALKNLKFYQKYLYYECLRVYLVCTCLL